MCPYAHCFYALVVESPGFVDRRLSPLWTVTREPLIHQFVGYLEDNRRRIVAAPDEVHVLEFSRTRVQEIQHAFRRLVRRGEERLHQLSQLLAVALFDAPYDLVSVVVGQDGTRGERFTLSQPIRKSQLYGLTDRDLGQRLLGRVRFERENGWEAARLIANAVEYVPAEPNPLGIHKIMSRIKAEAEIWNKVVDEIFEVDAVVERDKELRHLSRYVKDVFGLKVVVSDVDAIRPVMERLRELRWSPEQLRDHRARDTAACRRLSFLETKDYVHGEHLKDSGWKAVKSVVKWWDRVFEIQVQPLPNYYRERERITRESHAAFKERRERLRDELGQRLPLMALYHQMLHWLFLHPDERPPELEGVKVVLHD